MRFILGLFLMIWAPLSVMGQEENNQLKANSTYKIGIIIGSTRPNKIGGQVSEWIFQQVQETPNVQFTLIDLEKWNLPLFNEPGMPMNGPATYTHAYTKKGSQEIASYDGYIFVTPQYNCGYPASLKNAIDYLYVEWKEKPAIIVSYGYQDGGKKAATQLTQVLECFKMKLTTTMPAIGLVHTMLDEKKKLKNLSEDFKPHRESILKAVNELVENLKSFHKD